MGGGEFRGVGAELGATQGLEPPPRLAGPGGMKKGGDWQEPTADGGGCI